MLKLAPHYFSLYFIQVTDFRYLDWRSWSFVPNPAIRRLRANTSYISRLWNHVQNNKESKMQKIRLALYAWYERVVILLNTMFRFTGSVVNGRTSKSPILLTRQARPGLQLWLEVDEQYLQCTVFVSDSREQKISIGHWLKYKFCLLLMTPLIELK